MYAAITVRFERNGYPVANKNSLVQPVLLLSGAASFPFSIRVLEVDGTAIGMYVYMYISHTPCWHCMYEALYVCTYVCSIR